MYKMTKKTKKEKKEQEQEQEGMKEGVNVKGRKEELQPFSNKHCHSSM